MKYEKKGEKWNFFYAEKGLKITDKYFETESEVLEYILKELSEK